MKKLNKKAVFGLTAIQAFFAIILAIALLAYVIIIIMGTLGQSNILQLATGSAVNESVATPTTAVGSHLASVNLDNGVCGTITTIYNGTGGISMVLANFTQTGCVIVNTTSMAPYSSTLLISYPYTHNSVGQTQLNSITSNVSTGITGFFSSISPVYAILAVLVIILVLVVLVRVVQAPSGRNTTPQL